MTARAVIREKGETVIDLTLEQAVELQSLRFCRVTPTATEGRWRVTDVNKVGVAAISDVVLHVEPKTPLENIVYMASLGGHQLGLDNEIAQGASRALPTAIASAFLFEVQRATRRGLVKGYRTVEESATVVRGRWDIARQLAARPGIPLPVEIEFDDFTEDIVENQILASALRVVRGIDFSTQSIAAVLNRLQVIFADVTSLPRGVQLAERPLTRLTEHYAVALRLARVILESVSWTHRAGARVGGTFLVDMAAIFESYVAHRLRTELAAGNLHLTVQDRRWWLDADHAVALRPDLVISSATDVVTVADTKYKVLGGGAGAAPNPDVYQAVAYALALGVPEAHLIYVSGDVVARELKIPSVGVRILLHAVSLAGTPEEVDASVATLAHSLVNSTSPADHVAH